jgi:hypothetical protein
MDKPRQDMERKRPSLNDPKEFAIIREIYFGDVSGEDQLSDSELAERYDRYERRQRMKRKSSR